MDGISLGLCRTGSWGGREANALIVCLSGTRRELRRLLWQPPGQVRTASVARAVESRLIQACSRGILPPLPREGLRTEESQRKDRSKRPPFAPRVSAGRARASEKHGRCPYLSCRAMLQHRKHGRL